MSERVLYRAIADRLRRDIREGRLAPGARLPTEQDLTTHYAVSRHTAREALQLLRHEGLIIRRRGAGTIVASPDERSSFSQSIDGVEALTQYAKAARLEISSFAPLRASEAERLNVPDQHAWIAINGVRRVKREARPIASTKILVRADLCPPRAVLETWRGAINALIAERSGIAAARIEQTIAAVALNKREAALLDATPMAPALRTVRRYFDTHGALFQLSVSVHPGDRFIYTMRLDRD